MHANLICILDDVFTSCMSKQKTFKMPRLAWLYIAVTVKREPEYLAGDIWDYENSGNNHDDDSII